MITDEELNNIEYRCLSAQPGPWRAFIEHRDHESGGDFIMTGEDSSRGEDIELIGGTKADYDFIANAKQDVLYLVQTVRFLKKRISELEL